MKQLLVFAMVAAALATAQDTHAKSVRLRESASGQGLELRVKSGAKMGKKPTSGTVVLKTASAEEAAAALSDALGISVSQDELKVRSDNVDAFGRRHVRLRQIYRGLEVDSRELIVHFGKDGRVYEVNGNWLDGLELDVTPSISVDGGELIIFSKGDDAAAARLAWKKITGGNFVFTDALTGETLHIRRTGPRHAKSKDGEKNDKYEPLNSDEIIRKASTMPFPEGTATTISGYLPVQQGGFAITVGATAATDEKIYLTTTTADGIEIGVLDGIATPQYRTEAYFAYLAKDDAWFENYLADTGWTAYSNDEDEKMDDALAIIQNISIVLNYYKTAFNRSSFDGHGGRVAAWRFWQDDPTDMFDAFQNAFWATTDNNTISTNGCLFFGYNLSEEKNEMSLDTCAHELTHGITSWSSDLIYEGEPGALNESFSDIIAAATEFAAQPRADDVEDPLPGEADWLFDEDSGVTERSFVNPQAYDQPSRYKGFRWVDTSDTSSENDEGGVHANSGVQNHFFYLLCEGGTGRNDGVWYDLVGIGVEKATQIAYLALTEYCTPKTDYAAVMGCWDSAALDLVESGVLTQEDYAALEPAWDAVMSEPNGVSCGEMVYANDEGLLVKVGAPNARNRSRINVTLPLNGKTYKFSGYAQDAQANLIKRNVGELDIALGFDYAAFDNEDDEEEDDDDDDDDDDDEGVMFVPRASPLISEVTNIDNLRVGVAVEGELSLDDDVEVKSVRWGSKKLPASVKVTSKTGALAGVPKKAGSGEATIMATCKFNVPGQTKLITAKVARKAEWQVAPLDAWAHGKFNSEGIKISISKTGRINGYVVADGKKIRISAKSYTAYEDGKYIATGNNKGTNFKVNVSEDGISITLDTTVIPSVAKAK